MVWQVQKISFAFLVQFVTLKSFNEYYCIIDSKIQHPYLPSIDIVPIVSENKVVEKFVQFSQCRGCHQFSSYIMSSQIQISKIVMKNVE